MNSDFPDFDRIYHMILLPEDPNKFDLLAAQAKFDIYHHDLWNGTGRRFAELIVKECMGIVEDAVDHREPASTYVDKIKQHFGIDNEHID